MKAQRRHTTTSWTITDPLEAKPLLQRGLNMLRSELYILALHSHNLHIERYHRTIKMFLKPFVNLVCFCLGLQKINKFFLRKTILANEEIRGIKLSKSQRDFRGCHPDVFEHYKVEKTDVGFKILKTLPDGEVIKHELIAIDIRKH